MAATSYGVDAPVTPVLAADHPHSRSAFLEWVGQLVHEHRAYLATVARAEGLGAEEAFDAVQEAFFTFISLRESPALIGEDADARRLMAATVRNIARNQRRLHARARPHDRDPERLAEIAAEGHSVEELIAAAETHVRLAGCLRTLAEVPRAVVTLRMLDEVPGEDVARTLGITAGHVAVLLHRAKASLLACLTGAGPAPGPEPAPPAEAGIDEARLGRCSSAKGP